MLSEPSDLKVSEQKVQHDELVVPEQEMLLFCCI